GGTGPCHLTIDRSGRNVLVANYGGGCVAVLPIQDDGRLAPATAGIHHRGSSVNQARPEGPQAPSINVDPRHHFAAAADLGADKGFIYRFDAEKSTLIPNEPPSVSVQPGAGPRHFAFHPTGRYAYVINELKPSVTAFRFDAEHGTLHEIQTVSTLVEGFK